MYVQGLELARNAHEMYKECMKREALVVVNVERSRTLKYYKFEIELEPVTLRNLNQQHVTQYRGSNSQFNDTQSCS
jgi:hypothetical protein